MAAAKKPDLTEQRIEQLESQVKTLTAALEKVATLTGNGNHLIEFGLKRWIPGKKDLTKKYG